MTPEQQMKQDAPCQKECAGWFAKSWSNHPDPEQRKPKPKYKGPPQTLKQYFAFEHEGECKPGLYEGERGTDPMPVTVKEAFFITWEAHKGVMKRSNLMQ